MQFSDSIWWRHKQSKIADGRHIENRFLTIISSAPYWPINATFGTAMKDHMPIEVMRPKLQFSQTQDGGQPPFWNYCFICISEPSIIRFRSNLVHRYKFPFQACKFDKKIEIFQIQDGGRTPFWKSFLAIYRRHIGRSRRNLEQRWRITCRYRSRNQDCNFRKFKMADGRHFENSIISIFSAEN